MTPNRLLEKALAIALQAHQGQSDKAGQPYVLHPLRVMARMTTWQEQVTALLHDVLEDSSFTLEDLERAGFPAQVLQALRLLTRPANQRYQTYLEHLARDPLARKVKLADIEDNLQVIRLEQISEEDRQRLNKYLQARKFLLEQETI